MTTKTDRKQEFINHIAEAAKGFIREFPHDIETAASRTKNFATVLATASYPEFDNPDIIETMIAEENNAVEKAVKEGMRENISDEEAAARKHAENGMEFIAVKCDPSKINFETLDKDLQAFEDLIFDAAMKKLPPMDPTGEPPKLDSLDEISQAMFKAFEENIVKEPYCNFSFAILDNLNELFREVKKRVALEATKQLLSNVIDEMSKDKE